jgi:hypothetical protein
MVMYGGVWWSGGVWCFTVVCGGVWWCAVVDADVFAMSMHCAPFSYRRRLHGVQELVLFVLAAMPPSIPLMHQQLSMTTTFPGPETLGNVYAS